MCCVVHLYRGTGVSTFLHAPQNEYFMRGSLDIVMVPNVLTSCATAGMLHHKFNDGIIETTEPYSISPQLVRYTATRRVKHVRTYGYTDSPTFRGWRLTSIGSLESEAAGTADRHHAI